MCCHVNRCVSCFSPSAILSDFNHISVVVRACDMTGTETENNFNAFDKVRRKE
eukprot:m.39600 g.39600  ORF g.39600 m.39600 type:complete len:53 (-) comp14735_c1_seq2:70-228(-)